MDEVSQITEEQYLVPLPIPDETEVLRHVHLNELDKESKRFPKASHFKLREGEPDLSVNWGELTSIEEAYYILGITYNLKGKYKDIKQFKLFKFPVVFLRNIPGLEKVIHSPVFNGNPAPIGKPNNYAHASVFYPDDEEIRIKLSNYCNEAHVGSYCPVDYFHLEEVVADLKEKLNSTKYHVCKKTVNS
jgi:hypothetical protein